ncbi:MAG: arylsulfatase [Kiritimatiellaeota bacterium]|nr:arylsulfatase [Kiritimatiellota bacterium]
MTRTAMKLTMSVLLLAAATAFAAPDQPNVILLVTDDQGYGDLQAHGNPVIKTPCMNKLRDESVRFTDFHVAPMCSPTRGQLMSGMDAMRNGATAVCQGRSMVRPDIRIMPQFFAEAGYATGIFGKWHLGDSYPYRPLFRGFQEELSFRAWGIPSLAEHWGNTYFDPWFLHNGVEKRYEGYCTDIFFNEAMKWIEKCRAEKKPFFLYLPTNTPHSPDIVAEKYSAPYKGKGPAGFYGMIANIDENLGKLEAFLKEKGLRDNTILIFMSDNGTQSAQAMEIFNAGMRAQKRSLYEGGHRVPLFVRWINGKLRHGSDIPVLAEAQDVLPTLIELCGLKAGDATFDGVSLAGLLTGRQESIPDRMCVVQYGADCGKGAAAVMWGKWRLIGQSHLYDVTADPHQDRDVIAEHADVARKMRDYYDKWYAESKRLFDKPRDITIGSDAGNPNTLYASDWDGSYCDNQHGLSTGGRGCWDVIVDRDGTYEFELRRWPESSGKTLVGASNPEKPKGKGARQIAKAQLLIADIDRTIDTGPKDACAKFSVELKAGKTRLTANLLDAEGKIITSAPYVKAARR